VPKVLPTVGNASAGRSFGELLLECLITAGMSQEGLAERARMSAVSIRALERGVRRAPRRETIALLSEALAVDGERRAELEEAADRARARGRAPRADRTDPAKFLQHIPVPSTSIVGREDDAAHTLARLAAYRVVTVTGPGGIGKTRLALEIARRLAGGQWDEICFADLAPLSDGTLIAGRIASTIQSPLSGQAESLNDLVARLVDRRLFLILDNCEHLIADAAAVAHAIVTGCPHVTILATSRERLQISGESIHRLRPLALPDGPPKTLEEALEYPALDLFAQRSRQRDHSVVLSNDSVGFLYSICRRLEGIPLAIELAVARLPFLGIKMLDVLLDEHFSLPGAPRNLPRRQQTMEATIAWSFELLGELERAVFSRVAIFAGGFTLDAAQSVCAFDTVDRTSILRLLASLAEKSLINVVQATNSVRYVLLESVRAFALQQLDRSQLRTAVARRHAGWLAEMGDRFPDRSMQFEAFTELAPELENARAAVAWALKSPHDADRVLGGRIIAGLRELWAMSGRRSELRNLSVSSIALIDERKNPAVAAKMLHGYIVSAFNEPDALAMIERAIPLFDLIGDARAIIALHSSLTFIFAFRGLIAEAHRSAERVDALFAAQASRMSREYVGFLYSRATLSEIEGRFDEARADVETAEAIASALDYKIFINSKLKLRLIFIEFGAGNMRRAVEIGHEMLASEHGTNPDIVLNARQCLLLLHLLLGEADAAAAEARAVLSVARSDESLIVEYVAAIAALRGHPHVAARLMGFIDALLTRVPGNRDALQQRAWELLCTSVAKQLHPDVIALLRTEGASLSAQAASAEALAALALPQKVLRS
jgi:predicted ATPase